MVKILTIKDFEASAQRSFQLAPRWITSSLAFFLVSAWFTGVASAAYLVCCAALGAVGFFVGVTIWRTRRDSIFTLFFFFFVVTSCGAGVLILVLTPWLKKLTGGREA